MQQHFKCMAYIGYTRLIQSRIHIKPTYVASALPGFTITSILYFDPVSILIVLL